MVSNPTASNRVTVNNRATVPLSMEDILSKGTEADMDLLRVDTAADISRLRPRKVVALVPAEERR